MMDVDWPRVLCGNDYGPMWEALNFPVRRRSRALAYGHSRSTETFRSVQALSSDKQTYHDTKKYIVIGGAVS